MMMMTVMMSGLLADANEWISAGSPRIGTGVNILPKTSTPCFFPPFTSAHLISLGEQRSN